MDVKALTFTFTLAFIAMVCVVGSTRSVRAITAAQHRSDACKFDRGSAAISPECKLKLGQIATCWTHPRVPFGMSAEEEERWLENRTVAVLPYAASNERPDVTAEWLVAQRGANIVNYLTSVGAPHDQITLAITDYSVVPVQSGSARLFATIEGCFDRFYRRDSYSNVLALDPADPKSLNCPLPGEDLDSTPSSSYTTFGMSLDFEPLVMGMLRQNSPGVLHCSDTPLPVYKHYTPSEAEHLRKLVREPAWQQQVAYRSLAYLQAYTQQYLGEDDLTVAWSLLHAVWSAKPDNRTFLLNQAVAAWSKVAARRDHDDAWVAANWLQVDLNRQVGDFAAAGQALEHFQGSLYADQHIVTGAMLTRERRLIELRNPAPYAATAQYPDP